MNYQREIAGIFAGAGALFLIYKGEIAVGATLLSAMLAFFIGEKNGQKKVLANLLASMQKKVDKYAEKGS